MNPGLHVPNEAIEALDHVHRTYGDLEADAQVRAIATPVLVAYLRHLGMEAGWQGWREATGYILARANEFEAGEYS